MRWQRWWRWELHISPPRPAPEQGHPFLFCGVLLARALLRLGLVRECRRCGHLLAHALLRLGLGHGLGYIRRGYVWQHATNTG